MTRLCVWLLLGPGRGCELPFHYPLTCVPASSLLYSIRKLARFADQIGASRRLVYAKFQSAMNELLQDIQELLFVDDQKSQSK